MHPHKRSIKVGNLNGENENCLVCLVILADLSTKCIHIWLKVPFHVFSGLTVLILLSSNIMRFSLPKQSQ